MIERVEDLFLGLFEKCAAFVRTKCVEYERLPESAHVPKILRLLGAVMPTSTRKLEEVDALFAYALMWTVAGCVDETGRKVFELYFKKLLREPIKLDNRKDKIIKFEKSSVIPELAGTMAYDFYYDQADGRWRNWKDCLGERSIPKEA